MLKFYIFMHYFINLKKPTMSNLLNRRHFLAQISTAALAAGFSTLPFSSMARPANEQKKLGIALIGLGYYSKDLLMPAL